MNIMKQLAIEEPHFPSSGRTTLLQKKEKKGRLKTDIFLFSPALKSQDAGTTEAEGAVLDEREDISSTAGPQLADGVTERSNSTSNRRSSQILYVITSSPGKAEQNMPGQWAGRGETTGHNSSM